MSQAATQSTTAPLAGKVAIVTGGSRGIGAAIATRLARDGAHVAITYSASPAKADAVVTEIASYGVRGIAISPRGGDLYVVTSDRKAAASIRSGRPSRSAYAVTPAAWSAPIETHSAGSGQVSSSVSTA